MEIDKEIQQDEFMNNLLLLRSEYILAWIRLEAALSKVNYCQLALPEHIKVK